MNWKFHRTTIFSIILSALLFNAQAQQKNASSSVPLPIVPMLIEYEYAPLYMMQFLNGHARYTQIEAVMNTNAPPVYQIVLTEKNGKRVWHSNVEAKTRSLAQLGRESHLTAIDYKTATDDSGRQIHGVAFRDKHGQSVRWRFIPASDPSERGSGLTPRGNAPGLRLDYRDLGTLAGEGTVAQFDEQIIEAEPWSERSSPPYFVGYRGSITLGHHSSALAFGREEWRVVSAPKTLREGAEWKLVNRHGQHERERKLHVTSLRGDDLTINESGGADSSLSLNARFRPEGWALRSLQLISGGQTMRLVFTPELNLAASGEAAFQIDQSNQQKLAHGIVIVQKQSDGARLRWQPKAPDWAKSKGFETVVKINAAEYVVETSPIAKN
ncbi:MAG: hypothetical protein SF097_06595 [Acidobacteriota bacterium]|nr:hypothetical protein [Acidobacteriota bacterium]